MSRASRYQRYTLYSSPHQRIDSMEMPLVNLTEVMHTPSVLPRFSSTISCPLSFYPKRVENRNYKGWGMWWYQDPQQITPLLFYGHRHEVHLHLALLTSPLVIIATRVSWDPFTTMVDSCLPQLSALMERTACWPRASKPSETCRHSRTLEDPPQSLAGTPPAVVHPFPTELDFMTDTHGSS